MGNVPSAHTRPGASPISASATARSIAAAAIPTSIRRRVTNSPRSRGFTYNFENPDTDYKNGVDLHLDWAASQFLSKQVAIGLVGYAYQQVSGDSGAGARLGDFKSRVFGIGPQLSYIIPLGEPQGYLNLKGYKEFDAENRAEGWNVWLTFAISPAATPPTPVKPAIRK